MANLNKVMLIGRLTKDPEVREFANGGKVASISFAVNNRVKNQQTGQWEDKPCWLDLKAYNRETRKLADLCQQYLKKGHQAYIEGHLVLEEWDDKETGQKRRKHVIVIEEVGFLEPKGDGSGTRPASPSARTPAPAGSLGQSGPGGEYDEPNMPPSGGGHQDEEIPF